MRKNGKMRIGYYGKNQKKSSKVFIYLMIVVILLTGFFYQTYSVYRTASEYGRFGKLITINGTSMHLYTSGSSDIPLVFASNLGSPAPYVEMQPLVKQLPEETAVAIYDKPGYGWSDLTKAPRDINTIVSEIHTLLEADHYTSPFILVAHSMGSLEVLRYAQLYPDNVAGIVLIDGASPEFFSEFNNVMIAESFLMNALRNTGVLRLFSHTEAFQKTLNPNNTLPKELKNINAGIALEKLWNRNIIEEKLKLQDNAKILLQTNSLGDIPLRIITSKSNPYGNWQQTQTNLLKLSSDSSQTYIEGSVNFIENKDVPAILAVIEELKLYLTPEEE